MANGSEESVPLTGETLITSEAGDPGTSQVEDLPLGTSTFTYTVTGVASALPGTFVEEGSFALGPVGFPIESFEATFTITSAAGTVTGTKTLTGATSIGSGVCGAFAFGGTEAEAVDLQTRVRYTAQITTPSGTATDSGDSVVSYDETQLRGEAAQGNGFSFTRALPRRRSCRRVWRTTTTRVTTSARTTTTKARTRLARRAVRIAEASPRLDRNRVGRFGGELLPEVADVELDLVARRVGVPRELEQLLVGQHLVRMTDERRQQRNSSGRSTPAPPTATSGARSRS